MNESEKTVDVESLFQKVSSSSKGLSSDEAKKRLDQYGLNAIIEKKQNLLVKTLRYFWGPIPWMIEAAAILSALIHHWADFILIISLLIFNAFVAFWQEYQAGNAIEALKKKLALKSRALRDGSWQEISALALVPGDVIRIRLGDIIPADAVPFEGEYLSVDQSILTGESLPITKKIGDTVYSGTIAQKGEMIALVIATGKDTYFGKTAKLVASAKPVSHFQKAVLRIGDFLIYICLGLIALLVVVQIARHAPVFELLKFALILTVASIPVAMPAVLSVTMAVGALALAKKNAIVSKLESIEEMAGIDILCSDKTGTLTYNKMVMGKPALFSNSSEEEVLLIAALASKAEDLDPIDKAILDSVHNVENMKNYTQQKFVPFDPVSKKTEATIQDPKGEIFWVTKGAPQVIRALCKKDPTFEAEVNQKIAEFAKKGYRTLGVAKAKKSKEWEFLGLLPLFDGVRNDSKETIKQANIHGIEVKMLTGDNLAIAQEVSRELGIGKNIFNASELSLENTLLGLSEIAEKVEKANGFAQVYPESKFLVVKALQSKDHIVGMTGDGVNDAPALKQADLGIAVSSASDAARAAASLVLTAPGLSVIIAAVEEARRIFERMNTYAIYRVAETIRVLLFMVLAMLTYNFYPITALMLIMLALLNDIPIMTIAYDRTNLPLKPVRWQMHRVITIACVLGAIGVISSFLLLVIADSIFQIPFEQIQSIIFLKLSLAGHSTLFIVRSRSWFWKKPYPAPALLAAILSTQAIAALIVGFGFLVTPIPWTFVGLIWLYALTWMFIVDYAKVLINRHRAYETP